ncbi:hypothetical protein [Acinetobacter baumannii]|uniref:hypothetical protein n=1 Tax=Acinetobacter baumannii TaxID=470 RepID=UPI00112346C7|nr:hypothetical protein [Acinetobacter baumannii]MBD0229915.1 hypothetical protein [Acinetobacter baumannii]MBL4063231.1 hypothetical protein [Acinetobacter baumannii]MBP4148699.1 hypothetical protein [Acinetobacter baumannii]MBP4156265.1 hypothetical protein [Acinetobacter baumannii]MBP4167440.1 hypothetical protein [Acinetobacter baumannii]
MSNNPETIEIHGLKTIHKLCKFAVDHDMAGRTFTEILNHVFEELETARNKKTNCVILTCAELKEAFDFGAPDGEKDQSQMETEMLIKWLDDGYDGAGYYCWYADLPEEGCIKLGESESGAEG